MCDKSETEPRVTPCEIERKFLVTTLPDDLDSRPHNEIFQGYLAIGADGSEVRLRRKGAQHYQTIKSAGGLSRAEYEIELTQDQFQLWRWYAVNGIVFRLEPKAAFGVLSTVDQAVLIAVSLCGKRE